MVDSCSEVAKSDAKESEARCKAILNKLISEVKKQTLEMEGLAESMNKLAVGLKAIVQPPGAPTHDLPPPVPAPTATCVTAVDHAVAAATPRAEASLAPESPTKCSTSDPDTNAGDLQVAAESNLETGEPTVAPAPAEHSSALSAMSFSTNKQDTLMPTRYSTICPDRSIGVPTSVRATAVPLTSSSTITSPEPMVTTIRVRNGTSDLATHQQLEEMPLAPPVTVALDVGSGVTKPNGDIAHDSYMTTMRKMDKRQPWPPPKRVEATGVGAESRPAPGPMFICYEGGVQLKQPPIPGCIIKRVAVQMEVLTTNLVAMPRHWVHMQPGPSLVLKLVNEVQAGTIFTEEEVEYSVRSVLANVESSLSNGLFTWGSPPEIVVWSAPLYDYKSLRELSTSHNQFLKETSSRTTPLAAPTLPALNVELDTGSLPTLKELKGFLKDSTTSEDNWVPLKSTSARSLLQNTPNQRKIKSSATVSVSNKGNIEDITVNAGASRKRIMYSMFASESSLEVRGGTDITLDALAVYLKYLDGIGKANWQELHDKVRLAETRNGVSFYTLFGPALQLGVISRRRVYHETIQYERDRNAGFLSPFGYSTPTVTAAVETICSMEYTSVGHEGPAVLLVHGFGAPLQHFCDNIGSIADEGNRAWAITLLGFGKSEKPNVNYTEPLWSELLRDFITDIMRATIANMSPEYGATMGFFPVDGKTLDYLKLTGRSADTVAMIESYLRANKIFVDYNQVEAERVCSSYLELNLEEVATSLSGPKRPHDRVILKNMESNWLPCLDNDVGFKGFAILKESQGKVAKFLFHGTPAKIKHGDVVIAAITSCTNTSNPNVMLGASKKACELGLEVKPWIKTSLAPGSGVMKYLDKSGLQKYLDQLGFNIVGYGCTTCIGNSEELDESVSTAISENDIVTAAVLSGNRNFEGRVHPLTRANYLASPLLVVAYALAGTVNIDFEKEPIGISKDGKELYSRDIWPSTKEIAEVVKSSMLSDMFKSTYEAITKGNPMWNELSVPSSTLYHGIPVALSSSAGHSLKRLGVKPHFEEGGMSWTGLGLCLWAGGPGGRETD